MARRRPQVKPLGPLGHTKAYQRHHGHHSTRHHSLRPCCSCWCHSFVASTCKSSNNLQCMAVLGMDPRSVNTTMVRELAYIATAPECRHARAHVAGPVPGSQKCSPCSPTSPVEANNRRGGRQALLFRRKITRWTTASGTTTRQRGCSLLMAVRDNFNNGAYTRGQPAVQARQGRRGPLRANIHRTSSPSVAVGTDVWSHPRAAAASGRGRWRAGLGENAWEELMLRARVGFMWICLANAAAFFAERKLRNSQWLSLDNEIDSLLEVYFALNSLNQIIEWEIATLLELL
jgi:hypothetical protein